MKQRTNQQTNGKSAMKMLILPLPPTDNRLRMPARGRLVKTPEYRQWVKDADVEWKLWRRSHPRFTPYRPCKSKQMEFQFYLHLPSWRTDLGNYTKALADFLGGNKNEKRLFTDDHYISMRLILPVETDKDNPRVEVCPFPDVY